MIDIPIFNDGFKHNGHIIPTVKPKNINWVWDVPRNHDYNFPNYKYYCLTDDYIWLVQGYIKENAIALICESEAILPNTYNNILKCGHLHKFKYIFTHNEFLLENYPNTKFCPAGGVWAGSNFAGGELGDLNKSKLCSIVSSSKKMCQLHDVRHTLAWYLKNNYPTIDVYGDDFGGWVPINKTLEDYRYSIVIENAISKYFFTEKILNCFATKTIPIYLGATKISDFFDDFGIIQCNNVKEIFSALDNISEDDYNLRYQAILNNFNRVQKYITPEDYIWNQYLKGEE